MAVSAAADFPDPDNRLIGGRYRLIALLATGGMGETWRAWDTVAGLPVVVKMPKREMRHDKELMTRFSREIDAMRSVTHESIVPIADSGEHDGCPFVVMRFLPGGSLAEYRRRNDSDTPKKNPPGMLHFWLPAIAAALDHIHAKGMLHRDVKPANIFLDGFLRPFLGDFGIAKVLDDSGGLRKEQTLTATHMSIGTPEYMAPELFKPRVHPDGTVDQYALAVTVYEMLAGEKPFTGTAAHIVVEHSSLPVPPLDNKCPGLPPSACDAVHKALAKKPEERFATCQDFAMAALAEIQPLEREADAVRLLCPSCRNILKLPQKSAGKKGRCPRCQSTIDVTADLGSLWLESEEHDNSAEPAGPTVTVAQPLKQEPQADSPAGTQAWRPTHIVAMLVAILLGFMISELTKVLVSSDSLWFERERTWLRSENIRLLGAQRSADREINRLSSEIQLLSERHLAAEAERNKFASEVQLLSKSLQIADAKLSRLSDENRMLVESQESAASARERHASEIQKLTDSRQAAEAELTRLAAENRLLSENLFQESRRLTSLNVAQAKVFANLHGYRDLAGLVSLSDDAAEALTKHRGDLRLSGLVALTDRQAVAFAKYPDALYLDGVTTLTDAQAEALGGHRNHLHLNALTSLTTAQAVALASHNYRLYLNGLTTLTSEAANALAQQKGHLSVDRLTALSSVPLAEKLAKQGGPYGCELNLRGLTTLTAPQAQALAKHKGVLNITGLTSLSDGVAAALAKHECDYIRMTGIAAITDDDAKELAKYRGFLYLDGVAALTDAQAAALAKKKGGALSLGGLKTLSDQAVADLRANPKIFFPQRNR